MIKHRNFRNTKRTLRKSDVLREGYIQGLKAAKRIIRRMMNESGLDGEDPMMGGSGESLILKMKGSDIDIVINENDMYQNGSTSASRSWGGKETISTDYVDLLVDDGQLPRV